MDSRSVLTARSTKQWIFVPLEKATMGASNRLSGGRGLSTRVLSGGTGIGAPFQTGTDAMLLNIT